VNRSKSAADLRISEEAALWLIEFDAGTADRAQFAAWLQASPRHVEEFLAVSAVWHVAQGIDRARQIDVGGLIAAAMRNVHPLDDAHARPELPVARHRALPQRWFRQVAAACAALLIGVAVWSAYALRAPQYVTGIGEQRALKLPDGSLVTLNTRSRIRVRFDEAERRIELAAGEAHFDVQPDPARPFRVVASGAVVQAVGTQFNVRRAERGTTVAVLSGIVQVAPRRPTQQAGNAVSADESSARLVAGEQAHLSLTGELLGKEPADLDRISAWRARRLIFRDQPLSDIATEFNRYNATQLVVEGSRTGARRMTGVFDADDPSALLSFLERESDIVIDRRDTSIVIRGP
jgi:transmembrane sensor